MTKDFYKPFNFALSLRGGDFRRRSKSYNIKKSKKLRTKKVKKVKKKKLVPKPSNYIIESKENMQDIIPKVSDKSSDKRKLKEVDQNDVFVGKD